MCIYCLYYIRLNIPLCTNMECIKFNMTPICVTYKHWADLHVDMGSLFEGDFSCMGCIIQGIYLHDSIDTCT